MKAAHPISGKDLDAHNNDTASHLNGFNHNVFIKSPVNKSSVALESNKSVDIGDFTILDVNKVVCAHFGADALLIDNVRYTTGYVYALADTGDNNDHASLHVSISADGSSKIITTNATLVGVNAAEPKDGTQVTNKNYVDGSISAHNNSPAAHSKGFNHQLVIQYEPDSTAEPGLSFNHGTSFKDEDNRGGSIYWRDVNKILKGSIDHDIRIASDKPQRENAIQFHLTVTGNGIDNNSPNITDMPVGSFYCLTNTSTETYVEHGLNLANGTLKNANCADPTTELQVANKRYVDAMIFPDFSRMEDVLEDYSKTSGWTCESDGLLILQTATLALNETVLVTPPNGTAYIVGIGDGGGPIHLMFNIKKGTNINTTSALSYPFKILKFIPFK